VSPAPGGLLEYFSAGLDESLSVLRTLVELESFSGDKSGVDSLAEYVAGEFKACGAAVETLPLAACGNALVVRWSCAASASPIMLLCHLDTVWEPGTIRQRPFRVEDGRAYGPGVFDMKSSILLCLLISRAFRAGLCAPGNEVLFFFAPDEETGSAASLPALERLAGSCRAVLCLEPPLPGGRAKTSRKGSGEFSILVQGIAAHAGLDHEKGANAILELSRIVLQLQAITDYERGISVNVGIIRGGAAANVVPAVAEAKVDLRYLRLQDGQAVEAQIRSLRPTDARCTLRVAGGIDRPPLERTAEVARLYEKARGIADSIGMPFGEGPAGGASDGSLTAALGIPTLDGLGVDGDGAHADHEHVIVADIPRRAALLCELLRSI
jgi:glutamate carboxypeptidase